MYTDSHCHLNILKKKLHDSIQEARDRHVKNILSICTSLDEYQEIREIASQYDNIWCTVGVHPLEVKDGVVTKEELCQCVDHDEVVGFGETGLDFYYSQETQQQQTASFIHHLQAGIEKNIPVVVHTRAAKRETLDCIKNYKESRGVLHCFTEDLDMAKQALDLGYYISISGIITFKKVDHLKEVVKYVPENRLLIETDAPFLAPVPYRGKPNEPKFVVEVAQCIAQLRDMPVEKLAQMTTDNFFMLFDKTLKTHKKNNP